jgi:hypothetical protein
MNALDLLDPLQSPVTLGIGASIITTITKKG